MYKVQSEHDAAPPDQDLPEVVKKRKEKRKERKGKHVLILTESPQFFRRCITPLVLQGFNANNPKQN